MDAWPHPDSLDALAAAPRHHKLLFENTRVRVLDTRIPPGERTAVHTHRWASVLHVLSLADFVRRDAGGAVVLDTRVSGTMPDPSRVLWSEPLPPHSLENVGQTEIHIISVELKD